MSALMCVGPISRCTSLMAENTGRSGQPLAVVGFTIAHGRIAAIGDLDFATAQQTAKELGHGTVAFPLDVTQRASFKDFLDGAEAQLGDVLRAVHGEVFDTAYPDQFLKKNVAEFQRDAMRAWDEELDFREGNADAAKQPRHLLRRDHVVMLKRL